MPLLKVLTYPNPKLREVAQLVTHFDETLHQLLKDLFETMYEEEGLGLAATQVGIPLRILVMDDGREHKNPKCFINPEIIAKEGEVDAEEGCLSLPGITVKVKRSKKVTVRYQDEFGKDHTLEADGIIAHCLQHEIDHLNGILSIDHVSKLKQMMLIKKMKKFQPLAS